MKRMTLRALSRPAQPGPGERRTASGTSAYRVQRFKVFLSKSTRGECHDSDSLEQPEVLFDLLERSGAILGSDRGPDLPEVSLPVGEVEGLVEIVVPAGGEANLVRNRRRRVSP
jgi:hypothetical protein